MRSIQSFTCAGCNLTVRDCDWCLVRDQAIKHLAECRPKKIEIYGGLGIVTFRPEKKTKKENV